MKFKGVIMFYVYGTDCAAAPVEIRERLSLSAENFAKAAKAILSIDGVNGCMPLSTCNRSEVYISCDEKTDTSEIRKTIFNGYEAYCRDFSGEAAVRQIFNTACGLNSLIKRETQIITQFSEAEQIARGLGCLDARLEVLIRTAITAAKKAAGIVTEDESLSGVQLAADWLEKENNGLKGRKCLVIGSGKVGRLAAKTLIEKGADVTMTLRTKSENILPRGCRAVDYEKRYDFTADIIISATKSPHFTLTEDKMQHYPQYIADLAVPRDISPKLREKYGEKYRCIDDFISIAADYPEIYEVIENGINEYYLWENFRNSIPVIDDIKDVITKRLCAANGCEEAAISETVARTADMLLCGMKDCITGENMQHCLEKLKERARL